jgi:hypothetical protein
MARDSHGLGLWRGTDDLAANSYNADGPSGASLGLAPGVNPTKSVGGGGLPKRIGAGPAGRRLPTPRNSVSEL